MTPHTNSRTSQADPTLDSRDAATALANLLKRLDAYTPGWRVGESGPARAMLGIAARYVEVLVERLNRAPDKNLLAFLELLGQNLVEVRAARAPIVFLFSPPEPPPLPAPAVTGVDVPGAGVSAPPATAPMAFPVLNARVPAGTQVAANGPGGVPIAFETEQAIALVAAKFAQVVSLWPGRDTYADHTPAVLAKQSFTLFQAGVAAQPTPHAIYLAHDAYFVLSGQSTVQIEFDLLQPSSQALPMAWDYWDGQGWHPFGDPDLKSTAKSKTGTPKAAALGALDDGTDGLTRGGIITMSGDCVDTQPTTVNGVKGYWLKGSLREPLPPDPQRRDALVNRIRVNTLVQRLFGTKGLDEDVTGKSDPLPPNLGIKADKALADGSTLDLSKAFFPFGQSAGPGNAFLFSSEEAFSKSGASVRLAVFSTPSPLGDAKDADGKPIITWEYYDGEKWLNLTVSVLHETTSGEPAFSTNTVYSFTVPEGGISQAKINDKDGRWVRARIISGNYSLKTKITSVTPNITISENRPPMLSDMRIAYVYQSPRALPQRCFTYNDFFYEDHTADVQWPASGFTAFRSVDDPTPALYVGFDKPLPADLVSLYLDIVEVEGTPPGPPLTWEYWDGGRWRETALQDSTARLARPGMVAFIGAADSAALPRFDPVTSLHWLRGRLRDDGEPAHPTLSALYPNAVWASHGQTVREEVLGSGSGEPRQTFFARRLPLLEGEILEVRELDGPRAAVELPILAREIPAADLNVVREAGGGLQVWVRWHAQPDFYLSASGDRHYTVERSGGRILFGDGQNGRILPAGRDNVRLRLYRTGGGSAGNVSAGSITQLLGGIPYVSGVTNPRAAEGGADGETTDGISVRGPQALRHRERALSARDYESLARQASPGVKLARAISTSNMGRHRVGWVQLIVIPDSTDPRPMPSFELRRQVQTFIEERAPAGLGGLNVIGPQYLPVGVSATLAPLDLSQAGPVGERVGRALESFFHPLTGGPEGNGWPFGRDVYLSDVAALIESLPGVDYAQELELLLDNLPAGEQIQVPDDRIVVAGTMRVLIRAAER